MLYSNAHTCLYPHLCLCTYTWTLARVRTHTHTHCGELRQRHLSLLIFFEDDLANFLHNVFDSNDCRCNLCILHIIRPGQTCSGEAKERLLVHEAHTT